MNLFKKPNIYSFTHFPGKNFEVNNWEISRFIINTIIPITSHKPFPLSELQLMIAAVIYFEPDLICDWGTHIGKSARIFYETSKAFSIHSNIYSIDLPDEVAHVEHPGNFRGKLVSHIHAVTLLQGDGVTEAIRVAKKMKSQHPLFFLDGDHSYRTVKRELHAINKSISNPIILIHDTFFQTKESQYNIGPYKAISRFIDKYPDYSNMSTTTGLPGMTLLYKKNVLI